MNWIAIFFLAGYASLFILLYVIWLHPLRRRPLRLLGALLLVPLFFVPWIPWRAAANGQLALAHATGLISYILLPLLLWHAAWWAVLQAGNLALWVLRRCRPAGRLRPLSARAIRMALPLLLTLTVAYSLWETHHIRVEPLTLHSPRIPAGTPPLRIALISDIHLDIYAWSRRTPAILRALNKIQPDLLLSAGDFLDAPVDRLQDDIARWADFHAPLGKYAILGNHEGYKPLQNAIRFHEGAGFRLLRGEAVALLPHLTLAGVDDPAVARQTGNAHTTLAEKINLPDPAAFTLLLRHQPLTFPDQAAHIQLQLSGHTHSGQIFPFHLLVRLVYPYFRGTYTLGAESLLHVNRGTGTWGPPFRLFAPPEITLITLLPAE